MKEQDGNLGNSHYTMPSILSSFSNHRGALSLALNAPCPSIPEQDVHLQRKGV